MRPRDLAAAIGALVLVACAPAPPLAPPPAPAPPCPSATPPEPKAVAAPPEKVVAPPAKTPEEAVARLFTSKNIEATYFTESFVKAVPVAKAQSIVDDMKQEGGAFKGVEKTADGYKTVFERGVVPTKCSLDAHGRIASLWFSPIELLQAPPVDATIAELRTLPGKTSALVLTDGKEIAKHEPDAKLAVGSAFKLAILDELRQRIESKKATWAQTIPLSPDQKSLPSGMLQDWPDGAPLTLHTLASLMISKSDNTATDLLLDFVGRTNVEKLAPGNAPFLSTREAFVLKAKSNTALLGRWRAGDEAARRKLLAEIAKTKATFDHSGEPTAIDVEWMFSARRLCELLARNKDLGAMHINPGVANAKEWSLLAYKGGSEPGVLTFATWAEKGTHKHCVVTTWNDETKAVDDSRLARLHNALLAAVRDTK